MRTIVAAAVACLSIVSLSHADDARASIRNELSIPPQELVPALKALSRDAQVHLVYLAEDVRGRRTPGAAGTLNINEALQRILSGTGLTFRYIDEQTISILPVAAAGASGAKTVAPSQTTSTVQDVDGARVASGSHDESGEGRSAGDHAGSVWSRFRLAQAEQAATQRTETARGSSSSTGTKPALEEIVVTAQKREERLQNVPISISVLSGADLDKSTAQGMTEVLSRVPGVAVSVAAQASGTLVAVRGVTAPSGFNTGSSPIGYYIDSLPFGFVRQAIVPEMSVYDLDRVEVLRGPQGTLHGAGSMNGLVRVLTKAPDLEEVEFKTRGSFSSTDFGGEGYRADAALNVPLVQGKLAARAVLGYQDLSGWIDKPTRRDANDAELRNARLKLGAQPTEQLSIELSAWLSRYDFGAPSTSIDNLQVPSGDTEAIGQDFESYGLKIGYDFPAFSITSTTSYLDYVNDGEIDTVALLNIPFRLRTTLAPKTFSEEINLTSTHGGSWRWTTGGMFRDGEDRLFQSRSATAIFPQSVKFISKSWAAFGEVTRVFLEGRLEATAGLRYFKDDVSTREESRVGNAAPAQLINRDSEFDATTPRLIVTWHPQEQATLYASYSEGFRSGFDQLPSVLANFPDFPAVEPDLLQNYEIGSKGGFWDGRINYGAAVYYMDWRDVQLPLVVVVDGVNRSGAVNGASASGVGVDLSFSVSSGRGLEFGVNASWNELEVDSPVSSAFAPGQSGVLFQKGDRLNSSPEYTAGAWADYAFPLGGNGLNGRLSVSGSVTSPLESVGLSGTGTRNFATGDRLGTGQASFSVESPDHWSVSLFVENFTNENGAVVRTGPPVAGIQTAGPLDPHLRPRTYGIQLEYRF